MSTNVTLITATLTAVVNATTTRLKTAPGGGPLSATDSAIVLYGSLIGSILCGLGFITSLISATVFAQPELQGTLFKYYLTESVVNTIAAFINVFLIFIYKDYSTLNPFRKWLIKLL